MIGPLEPAWQARSLGARTARRSAATRSRAAIVATRDAVPAYASSGLDASGVASDQRHPLADDSLSNELDRRASEIDAAFGAIEPLLRELVPQQFAPDFVDRANAALGARLGYTLPPQTLHATWTAPLAAPQLYAHCVLQTFCRLVERAFDRDLARLTDEGERAADLIARWGFHAIDITPCADGRLSGVVDYILRIPPAVIVAKQSYAGAMFEVRESMRHWEEVELRRWREGVPNSATEPTRFLKVGVYHFSSVDPGHEGCAAHGSDTMRAAAAVLERLEQFATAVERTHCCRPAVATLLVGVDTDTDAIRVHVPDARGTMDAQRFVDNSALYAATARLEREAAKDAIREAVAHCAGVAADDAGTEGMRWLCGYLLKNNIGQVDAVRRRHGAAYAERGHTERLIVVGDAVDDVQLRNLTFQAQMDTVEEGAGDLDVGIRILGAAHEKRGLAVPILVHFRFDSRIPGAEQQARLRAERLRAAIVARYAQRVAQGALHVHAVVRAADASVLVQVEPITVAERVS